MKNILYLLLTLLMLSACNNGDVSEKKVCDSSKDTSCLTTKPGNLENDVIIHIDDEDKSKSLNKLNSNDGCEKGYIRVSSFCVMRKEAIQSNRYKINTNSIEEAQAVCQKRGKKLINHQQWLEIASRVQEQDINFEMGKKKKFQPSRELFISNEVSIVDFASSQLEWVAWSASSLYLPKECATIKPGSANTVICSGQSFGPPISVGAIQVSTISNESQIALLRSGSASKHIKELYNGYIGNSPSTNHYGIRCIYEP